MFFKKINIILLFFILIYSGINSLSIARAAEGIEAKFLNFLLSEQNITDYILQNQYQSSWTVSLPEPADIVRQTWVSDNEGTKVSLTICFFDSEEAAIRGMHYYTHTTAEPWLWGTLFNGIFGRHSWRSFNNNKALLFAHGNIGVLLSRYYGDDQTAIPLFATAQMEKIEQNLAPQILLYREILKELQLSFAEYDHYLTEKVKTNLDGFTQISNEDSLWVMKDDGLVMGIRREWQNDQGRVIGIDICKLESNNLASEAADERLMMSNGRSVTEFGSISWEDSRSSDVLVCGNVVIHRYTTKHQQTSQDTTQKSSRSLNYLPFAFYDPFNLWPIKLWPPNLWLDSHWPTCPVTLFDNYFSNNNYQTIFDYPSPYTGTFCPNIFLDLNSDYEKAYKNNTSFHPFNYSGKDSLFNSEIYTTFFVNHYFDFSDFNTIYNNLYQFEPSWDYSEWFNNNRQPFLSLASLHIYPYMDFMVSQ